MEALKVLVVDDQEDIQDILKTRLEANGYNVLVASNSEEALKQVEERFPELVLLDIRLPDSDRDGIEILKWIKQEYPEIIVIMITAHGSIQIAVEAMKLDAYDFVEKPFDPETVRVKVDNALERQAIIRQNQYLRSKLKGDYSDIIGKSQKLMEVLHTIDKIASSDLTVLITGETGTGKGIFAKAIHDNSPRKEKPFIKADCVSYSEELLESELFGHKKGSFTGAIQDRTGRFENANGGTIFLDEIGDISPKAQLRLLRVLEDRVIERVGDSTPRKINVRIIAATNKSLEEAIKDGKFRLDLYHRIKSVRIELPPLRERREDIPDLIEYFVRKNRHIRTTTRFSDEAKRLMINFGWQGNIRELQNTIESAIALAPSDVIKPDDLPPEIRSAKFPEQNDSGFIIIKPGIALREAEKMLIIKTLDEVDGNKTQAAKLLGISLNGLRNKLNSYIT